MKPILSLVILIFILSHAFGQGHKKDSKKFQIGINYSPDYNYRRLTLNKENHDSKIDKEIRNKYETAKYGYTTGILISLAIHSKLAFTTGLQYSNKGYQIKKSSVANDLIVQAFKSTHFNYSYYYIDIPLSMSYVIGKKKLQYIISTGLTANLFINDKKFQNNNFSSNYTYIQLFIPNYDSNKLNLSSTLSCGFNYRIRSKIDIRIEPTFRYQLFNTRNTDLSAHLWNFGMNTAILYSF